MTIHRYNAFMAIFYSLHLFTKGLMKITLLYEYEINVYNTYKINGLSASTSVIFPFCMEQSLFL